MKIECKCGTLIIDSEASHRYSWTRTSDHEDLINTIESAINKIEGDEMKEAAIMKIIYALKTYEIWECLVCKRLAIFTDDGEVVFFARE